MDLKSGGSVLEFIDRVRRGIWDDAYLTKDNLIQLCGIIHWKNVRSHQRRKREAEIKTDAYSYGLKDEVDNLNTRVMELTRKLAEQQIDLDTARISMLKMQRLYREHKDRIDADFL